jgi:transcriptional regulator with GAF, ATPase, and Fis domain
MFIAPDSKPEFESLKERLLDLAQVRSVDDGLKQVVSALASRPHVALARIWLVEKGDICANCHMLARCHDRTACLHLLASAGVRQEAENPDWSRIDGEFQRIPLGVGKIGRVGASGEPIVVKDFAGDSAWLSRYQWAARQHIRGFNAQPIRYKDEILGVLAIFTSVPTPGEGPAWIRIFADSIAMALVNSRSFKEIDRLRAQLQLENLYLKEEVREARALGDIIGQSACMQQLQRRIEMVAPTDATVLILGESGTGKELVAREIHNRSLRNEHPLIRVNCASVPRELYESEFFGHVKGAFTGAIKDRAGRFEAAEGGTLFLDEVGEIPIHIQSKFLHVLQERTYERVGEERTRTANVRIIAATNRDLEKEVEQSRFRQDLYYRLNVFPIKVPPLRERKDDIPLLAVHFLEHTAQRLRLPVPRFTEAHARQLQSYDWPGNVRELQNATERALILAQQGSLQFELSSTTATSPGQPLLPPKNGSNGAVVLTDEEFRQRERENIMAALKKSDWKIHGKGGAAELLRVKPSTLISRIKKQGIKKP